MSIRRTQTDGDRFLMPVSTLAEVEKDVAGAHPGVLNETSLLSFHWPKQIPSGRDCTILACARMMELENSTYNNPGRRLNILIVSSLLTFGGRIQAYLMFELNKPPES